MCSNQLYNRLNELRSEIRLIEIVPSNRNSKVIYKLSVVSLDDKPRFTTLSYVWGDANVTEGIILDGCNVPVTRNLAAALRHVEAHWQATFADRDRSEFRLWADAICINQADLNERGSQVQLMRRIYSDAELMISWLGDGFEGIDTALKMLKTIARETKQQQGEMCFKWLEKYPSWRKSNEDDGQVWQALSQLSGLVYWKRVWIFQELILARRICFTHGTTRLYYEDAQKGARWLCSVIQHHNYGRVEIPATIDDDIFIQLLLVDGWLEIERVDKIRRRLRVSKTLPATDIEYLFSRLDDLEATDSRDHIYGFLGILETDITPDYHKSFAAVCDDYVDFYIRITQSLRFLDYAGIGIFDRDPNITLPSWVPNFVQRAINSKAIQDSSLCAAKLTISTGWSDRGLFHTWDNLPRKDGSALYTIGYLPTIILTVYNPISQSAFEDDSLYNFVRVLVESGSSKASYHPVEGIFRALVPESIMEPEKAGILQALSFLDLLILNPISQRANRSKEEQIEQRKMQLKLTDESDDCRWFFRLFHFQDDPKSLESFLELLNDSRSRPSEERLLIGLWSSQMFFRFASLSDGYIGLVPRYSRPGDILAIVKECNVPLIIREKYDHHVLIGPCFVHGFMCGEAAKMANPKDENTFRKIKIQ